MHQRLTDGFNLALVYLRKDYLHAGIFTLVFNDWCTQLKGRPYEYLLCKRKRLSLVFSDDPDVKILMGCCGGRVAVCLPVCLSVYLSLICGAIRTQPLETAEPGNVDKPQLPD